MKRIAYFLRKLADLFDPKVKPTPDRSQLTIEVGCDTSDFMKGMDAVEKRLKEIQPMLDRCSALDVVVNNLGPQ